MKPRKFQISNLLHIRKPHVVATISTPAGMQAASRLDRDAVDFLEIRLDALVGRETQVFAALREFKIPLICTARDPREGGINDLSLSQRRDLLLQSLPYAALIDVELRNFPRMTEAIDAAHAAGVGVIGSAHDFKTTPSSRRLKSLYASARWSGADIFKVAATAEESSQFATLLEFVSSCSRIPVAAMAMGRFGKVSRLALATAGSILNYGFLDRSAASGQWPAPLLKERITELL